MITDEEYKSWFNELEPCCFETENGDKTYYPKDQVDGLVKSMLETITELSIRLDNAEPELKAGLRNLTKRVEELECNLVSNDITKEESAETIPFDEGMLTSEEIASICATYKRFEH